MDGTLGQAGSLAGPDYLIGAEIGQQHGVNLFHSFGEFNIYQGESATFTGPDSISNVISRVTGGRSSEIDGILRNAISGADLYFINPSGVLFGPNAALDVDGSIYVSTADTLRFTDGGEFNARDPEVSVLSIAPAKAFGFSDGSAGKLDIHNAAIQVKEKETLSLIGKGVRIESATLTLPSGHLNLVSAASTGDIMLDNEGLNTGSSGKFGDIQVVDSAVNASGEGNVYIRGGRFELMNTRINARTETHEAGGGVDIKAAEVIIHDSVIDSSTSGTGRAGDISIESGGETVLSGGSRIYAVTEESANAGNAANIRIKAGKLRMTDASAVLGMTFGNGEGGEITVHVDESAMLTDSDISAQSKSGAQGNAGDVLLTAGQLALMDGGTVTSTAFGSADSGSVTVKVSGPLEVTGVTPDERFTSRIGANTYEEGGNAGDVWVEAESVTVKNGGTITSLTWGAGNGANISIKAEDSVTITGIAGKHRSGIGVDSFGDSEDAGNAGIISIETGKLEINRRGRLTSRTFGSGKGGDIIVKARGPIAIFGGESVSGIAADTRGESLSAGEAGNIRLEAGSLALTNGGIISSITSGPGKGGNIHVQVAGQTDIISTTSTGGRSFIGTNSQAIGDDEDSSPPSFGNAGEVAVESGGLNLENGGTVSSITFSPGDGGNVSLKISGDLTVSGISPDKRSVSLISTDAGSRKIDGPFGNAGTIVIETKNLTVKEEGTVSSTTFGNGQGGKVVINATESVNISGGSPESDFIRGIFAASQSEREDAGNSGKIFLNAKKLYITDNGVIATLAEKGAAGDIEINVADMRLTNQAGIASESFGPGNAGDIRINASNTVRSRNGIITAQAETAGGGNIELAARSLQLVHESPVSSTVIGGEGDGGNVTLNVGSFAALNNSDITARADQGRGGRITVNADVFLRAPDVELNASSNVIGNEGVVEVNAPDLDLSVALFIMPTPFLRDELRQECRNSSGGDAYSKFTIEPLEDIPVPPETLKTIHLID